MPWLAYVSSERKDETTRLLGEVEYTLEMQFNQISRICQKERPFSMSSRLPSTVPVLKISFLLASFYPIDLTVAEMLELSCKTT